MASAKRPQVTPLQEGELVDTKQMVAGEGVNWPRHKASTESVLIVTEGGCVVVFDDSEHPLATGESLIIPADTWHEIQANPAFTATHIMPKGLRVTFSA
ncbi:cupin domain-containing protein [Corynebacterium lubricantis]|uniref:cupin domain-containing protein n=1 Tax=Corynebacterium lubricantis TaxID=541095 RepID=UPI0003692BF6|nr:cupin domain-containing protein [Corynebacterium lubricantis]